MDIMQGKETESDPGEMSADAIKEAQAAASPEERAMEKVRSLQGLRYTSVERACG